MTVFEPAQPSPRHKVVVVSNDGPSEIHYAYNDQYDIYTVNGSVYAEAVRNWAPDVVVVVFGGFEGFFQMLKAVGPALGRGSGRGLGRVGLEMDPAADPVDPGLGHSDPGLGRSDLSSDPSEQVPDGPAMVLALDSSLLTPTPHSVIIQQILRTISLHHRGRYVALNTATNSLRTTSPALISPLLSAPELIFTPKPAPGDVTWCIPRDWDSPARICMVAKSIYYDAYSEYELFTEESHVRGFIEVYKEYLTSSAGRSPDGLDPSTTPGTTGTATDLTGAPASSAAELIKYFKK